MCGLLSFQAPSLDEANLHIPLSISLCSPKHRNPPSMFLFLDTF